MPAKSGNKGKMLSRDEILAVQDSLTEVVEVPEWGGSVRVKSLSGTERDAYEASMVVGKGRNASVNMVNIRAKLVQQTVVDEDGKQLFDIADVNALGRKSAAALQRIFDVARRLSGLTEEDVEELAKNSESDQGESSALT